MVRIKTNELPADGVEIRLLAPVTHKLPTSFIALLAAQFAGYGLLWLVLHLPHVIPPVNSGWYLVGSPYRTWVEQQPLIQWLTARPRLQGGLLLLAFGWLSASYGCCVFYARRFSLRLGMRQVLMITSVLALPLLFLPQLFSSDVYSYALYGRIPAIHGENPFTAPPVQFQADPLLPFVYWQNVTSMYGPSWIIVSLPLTALSEVIGGGSWAYVLVYKILALLCHLLNTVLIVKLLSGTELGSASWAVMAYAWHPFALVEFAGSGHNDSLMLLLVLFAFLLEARQRRSLALVLLLVAGMVKVVALLLVPLYMLYVSRQQRQWLWPLFRQAAVGAAVVVMLYIPFWTGPAVLLSFQAAPLLSRIGHGPAAVISALAERGGCGGQGEISVRAEGITIADACKEQLRGHLRSIGMGLFVVIYAGLAASPMGTRHDWISRSFWVLVAFIFLVAFYFQPWYGTWLLALAPLLRRPPLLVLGWCCALFLLYGVTGVPGRVSLAALPFILLVLRQIWLVARSGMLPVVKVAAD